MNTDEELLALVRTVTPEIDDPNRLDLSHWLAQHPEYLQTRKLRSDPPGFGAWFKKHVLVRHQGERLEFQPDRRPWNISSILFQLQKVPSLVFPDVPHHWNWLKRGGHMRIAGQPVIFGQPYGPERETLVTAAALQSWCGCPVTYGRIKGRVSGLDKSCIMLWYGLAGDPPIPGPAPIETFCRTLLEIADGGYLRLTDSV